MKLMALVIDDGSIVRYLKKIGEATEAPARAPPGGSPYWSSAVLRRKTLDDLDMTASAAFDS
jgi:hypothetical protein